jgi:replication factor A1
MKSISELQPKQEGINLDLTVVSVEEPREFNKYGKVLRVANAMVSDGSDEIKMSFWNDDIVKIKPGIRIKLENGYCSEFNGQKQLTTGKNGKFSVVGE